MENHENITKFEDNLGDLRSEETTSPDINFNELLFLLRATRGNIYIGVKENFPKLWKETVGTEK